MRVSVAAVVFLARRDGHRKLVLLRRQRASCVRCESARGIVSVVEIQRDFTIFDRARFKESPRWIRLALSSGVAKNEEETLRWISANGHKANRLAADLCHDLARSWHLIRIPQHIGYLDHSWLVISNPGCRRPIAGTQGEKCPSAIFSRFRPLLIPQTYSDSIPPLNDLELQVAHLYHCRMT